VEALKKSGYIDAELTFTTRQFNAAFAKSGSFGSVMSRFDGSNHTGMFRVSFQHQHYYFLTQETKQATYPSPLNQAWKKRVLDIAENVLIIPSTRARPSTGIWCLGSSNAFRTQTHTFSAGSDLYHDCLKYSPMLKTRLLLMGSKI
jgi:hypothetical protein